jgi:hypothetical protein
MITTFLLGFRAGLKFLFIQLFFSIYLKNMTSIKKNHNIIPEPLEIYIRVKRK